MSMSSSRPYIIRALYEWIVDNNCTPYVLVNAEMDAVEVPQEFVKDGQIVLNVSPTAVRDLLISNDAIDFNGRFGGIARHLHVPTNAVLAIYARENGQGMVFDPEETTEPTPDPEPTSPEPAGKPSGRPALKVVK